MAPLFAGLAPCRRASFSACAGVDPSGWIVTGFAIFDVALAASLGGRVCNAITAAPQPRAGAFSTVRSGFFVVGEIAVDQAGDVVGIALFLFQEGLVGAVVLDLDVVVRHRGLLVAGVRLFERDD